MNKVSTNKRCQFVENIVPINETSEQNSNGYCNVDFIFTLDQKMLPVFKVFCYQLMHKRIFLKEY